MPHHIVTLPSNKGAGAIVWRFVSAQCTHLLVFTLPFKLKCASFVYRMRNGQSLLASYCIKHSLAMLMRNCRSPSCNIWTRWYWYGNMRSTESSNFRTVVLGISNTQTVPLPVSTCPEVIVWYNSVATSSETIGRSDRVSSQMQPVSSNFCINSRRPCGVHGPRLWSTFGNKHASLPQHSSHFDNTVLQIYHELSQAESFRRHVRAHDWRINKPTSHFIDFLLWISGEWRSVIGIPPLSYANFLRTQRSCFIGWLVGWFTVGIEQ